MREDGWYEKRFGAPYFGIHRADLQKTLGAAFGAQHLHLGCRLVNLVEEPDAVRLEFANGRVEHADIVVGADGVRSTVRRWVTGADDAVYSGTSAFRGIVPTENLPSLPDPHAIQFWMGPDAHLLHYAIGGHGESVNFFAVVETPKKWLHDGSVAEVHEEVPVASFRGWHPAVTEMIKAAASPIRGRCSRCARCCAGTAAAWSSSATPPTACSPTTARAPTPRSRTPSPWPRCSPRRGRRPRDRVRPLPGPAARPHPQDPAQLLGDQLAAAPARRPGGAGAQRQGGPGAAGLRLDPRVRRPAGAAEDRCSPAPSPTGPTRPGGATMAQDDGAHRHHDHSRRPPGSTRRGDAGSPSRDLDIDSMTMLEVVVALEDRFGLLIPDDEWSRFSTVGDLVAHLERAGVVAPT